MEPIAPESRGCCSAPSDSEGQRPRRANLGDQSSRERRLFPCSRLKVRAKPKIGGTAASGWDESAGPGPCCRWGVQPSPKFGLGETSELPQPWVGTLCTVPGCSKSCPAWFWTLGKRFLPSIARDPGFIRIPWGSRGVGRGVTPSLPHPKGQSISLQLPGTPRSPGTPPKPSRFGTGAASIECNGSVWIEPAPVVPMGSDISIVCQARLGCPSAQLLILLNYSHAEGTEQLLPGSALRLRLRDFRMPLATATCFYRCAGSRGYGLVCGTELRAGCEYPGSAPEHPGLALPSPDPASPPRPSGPPRQPELRHRRGLGAPGVRLGCGTGHAAAHRAQPAPAQVRQGALGLGMAPPGGISG